MLLVHRIHRNTTTRGGLLLMVILLGLILVCSCASAEEQPLSIKPGISTGSLPALPVSPISAMDGFALYRESQSPVVNYDGIVRITVGETVKDIGVRQLEGITRYSVDTPDGKITILRQGTKVAGTGPITPGTMRAFSISLWEDVDLLSQNYQVKVVGTETVLGRKAYRLEVLPDRRGNPSQTLWVDAETRLRLKREDYDYRGNLVQRQEFVRLVFIKSADAREVESWRATLAQPTEHPGPPPFLDVDEASKKAGFTLLAPSYLPEGYEFIGVRLPRREQGSAHLIFSDGLGYISLFEKSVPWWARRSSRPTPGSTIEWEQGGVHMVLVGDVAPDELYQVATSCGRQARLQMRKGRRQ